MPVVVYYSDISIVSMKIYKPNTSLYLKLLITSLIITITPLFLNLENNVFSIFIGIGCGGVASVIVAWLIDVATCKDKSERCNYLISKLLLQFDYSITYCLQIALLNCALFDKAIDLDKNYELSDLVSIMANADGTADYWKIIYNNLVATYDSVDASMLLAYDPNKYHTELYETLKHLQDNGNSYKSIMKKIKVKNNQKGSLEYNFTMIDMENIIKFYDIRDIKLEIKVPEDMKRHIVKKDN